MSVISRNSYNIRPSSMVITRGGSTKRVIQTDMKLEPFDQRGIHIDYDDGSKEIYQHDEFVKIEVD